MSLSGACIRGIIAPLWAIKERSPYLRHLKTVEKMHHWALDRVQAYQEERLRALVRHAAEHTDYYRDCFAAAGVTPDDVHTAADLQRIPFLTKEDIRANNMRMVADNVPDDRLVHKKTSGSTGVSLELFVDEASCQWKRGVTIAYDRWSGWDIGERVGAIWGNPECYQNWRMYLRNLLLVRHSYLDTLKMDEAAMRAFHGNLSKRPPAILFGHAHSLFLFARFMEQHGLDGIRPRGIISTCMVLHDFERKAIERVFGCRVTNRYGCEEVSLIACECPEGRMHLNCDTLMVECVRDGKPVPPGEPGALVVTDLTNYGMPIIRYKVGDVGRLSPQSDCPCGCSYPTLEALEGRVADYVVTPDGQYISGISLTENFAMHLPGVKQMQIVQEQQDRLLFRLVKGEQFSEQTVRDIDLLAQKRFGERMAYQLEYVDSIQSEGSGKYRFCISRLPNPFA